MRSLAIPLQSKKESMYNFNRLQVQTRAPVTHIATTDNKCIVSCGTCIFDIDLHNFELGQKMSRGKSVMYSSDIRKDDELVITAEESGAISCNIISQHQLLKRYYGLKNQATVAKFTPDGYSVIGGNQQGHLIVWDLATATTQFAVRLSSEQITDIAILNEEIAIVSMLNGIIKTINYRNSTIESNVSEARPRQASSNYLINVFDLGCKVTQLQLKNQKQLYCVSEDHIFLLDIENYKQKIEIKCKSQQILKGVTNVNFYKQQLFAGCFDGTVRQFSENLKDQEIVYNIQKAITAFHIQQSQQLIIIGTPDNELLIVSQQVLQKPLSEKEQFKKQLQQPRQNIDTLIKVYKKAVINSTAADLLFKNNYAKALEYAVTEGFEQTVAVLRELEYLGGRATEYGVAGLSDAARLLFFKYVQQGLETEYCSLLLRNYNVNLNLTQSNMSDVVRNSSQLLQKEVKDWFQVVQEAYTVFK